MCNIDILILPWWACVPNFVNFGYKITFVCRNLAKCDRLVHGISMQFCGLLHTQMCLICIWKRICPLYRGKSTLKIHFRWGEGVTETNVAAIAERSRIVGHYDNANSTRTSPNPHSVTHQRPQKTPVRHWCCEFYVWFSWPFVFLASILSGFGSWGGS